METALAAVRCDNEFHSQTYALEKSSINVSWQLNVFSNGEENFCSSPQRNSGWWKLAWETYPNGRF